MPSNFIYNASGGLNSGGGGVATSTYYSYVASGGLNSSGSGRPTVSINDAGGGVSLGGSAGVQIIADIPFTFTWDVSEGVLRNWRVEGKCVPANHACPPTNVQDNGCPPNGSTMQFMMNVQAHSLTELCQKLQNKGWKAPIKKIGVWSQPVFKEDWPPGTDPSCNTLKTVDFSKIPPCIDFQVDQDLTVTGKFGASILDLSGVVYTYVASGGLGAKGSAPKQSNRYSYTASGGLGAGGSSRISAPHFFVYVASGGLGVGGSGNGYTNTYGTLDLGGGKIKSSVMDLGIIFGYEAAPALAPSTATVQSTCCPILNLPQILFVRHDLNRSKSLSDFLKVNGFTLPQIQRLMYSSQRNSWYTNSQFRGLSVDQTEQEVWNVVFEFGCVVENAILGVPANIWGFSVLVRRRSLLNSKIELTRLVLEFDPASICNSPNALDFPFNFDVSQLKATPSSVATAVFVDELGTFGGASYNTNPVAIFEIAASPPDLGVGMFDQSAPLQNILLSTT